MALLHDIQAALLDEKAGVGAALLKLRFLAARLGSNELAEWVKHELEGYPEDVEVPGYRTTGIIYRGTFASRFETRTNIPVASALIEHHAGKGWVEHEIREGLLNIDDMAARTEGGGSYSLDTGNLLLMIQDKIFKNLVCVSLQGNIDRSAFTRIQSVVRTKLLDLTLELERSVPSAADIVVGKPAEASQAADAAKVAGIVQQHIYNAPVTQIASTGVGASITTNVVGDTKGLVRALTDRGMSEGDAKELATIVSEEGPQSPEEPFGKQAKAWLGNKAKQGGKIAGDITVAAITEVAKAWARGQFPS